MCCGEEWSEFFFFFSFLRRRKEPVCVLRPLCDSGSCLLAGASIPAQLDLGGNTAWRRRRASEYRGGPQAATRSAAPGQQWPLQTPRRRSSPRPRGRWPQSPVAGRSEGQSGALLQLIDCESRMLNLLISGVVWARTVNYQRFDPPSCREMPGKFSVEKGNFVCSFVLLFRGTFFL